MSSPALGHTQPIFNGYRGSFPEGKVAGALIVSLTFI